MFYHGMFGEGNDLGPDIKSIMIKEVWQISDFKDTIFNMRKTGVYYIENYEFTPTNSKGNTTTEQMDLYYSVQHASLKHLLTIKNDRRYYTTTLKDRYDFTVWRNIIDETNGFNVGNAANDLGFVLQKLCLMTPYDWEVTFTYKGGFK